MTNSMKSYENILLRGRWIYWAAACLSLLLICAGGWYSPLARAPGNPAEMPEKPVIVAESLLLMARECPYVVTPPAHNTMEDYRLFCQTQAELMCSSPILLRVAAHPDVGKILKETAPDAQPIEWIRERLVVTQQGRSELWAVRFYGPSLAASRVICDAIVEAYFKVRSQGEAIFCQQQIELLEDELSRKAEVLARLVEGANSSDSDAINLLQKLDLTAQEEVCQKLKTRVLNARIEVRAPDRVKLLYPPEKRWGR